MIRKRLIAVMTLLAALPSTGFARLGGMEGGDLPPSWWTADNPAFTRFAAPSSSYFPIMFPVLLCLLIILTKLTFRIPWRRGGRWSAIIASVVSGVFLFGVLPYAYRQVLPGYQLVVMEMGAVAPPKNLCLVIGAIAQARWGLVLLLIWFVIQPQIIEITRHNRKTDKRGPVTWPLSMVFMLFCMGVIIGLLRPLCILI